MKVATNQRPALAKGANDVCPAREKGKQGCDCSDEDCAEACHHTTLRDPEARFIVYAGNKRAKTSPNTPVQTRNQRASTGRMVYGYYSYAGQLLDDELATRRRR